MITGSVLLDLARGGALNEFADDAQRRDRAALYDLFTLPRGVNVTVNVGSRTWVDPDTAQILNQLAAALNLHFTGTPRADIGAWIAAAKTGEVS